MCYITEIMYKEQLYKLDHFIFFTKYKRWLLSRPT